MFCDHESQRQKQRQSEGARDKTNREKREKPKNNGKLDVIES